MSVTRDEKMYMAVAAGVGGLLALALTVWASPSALAFDTPAACEEITSRIAGIARSRFKSLPEDALVPFREAGPVGAGLALVAALLGEHGCGLAGVAGSWRGRVGQQTSLVLTQLCGGVRECVLSGGHC